MKSKLYRTGQFVLFLLLGIVLLYFAFRGIDLDDVTAQIRNADYRWVAFSLFFGFVALILRTLRWQMLIKPLDRHPKTINIFHAINTGYLANFVFPRIGEITRCGVLNRTDDVPVDKLFGTVVVERVFDMLLSIFSLCLILILRFDAVSSFITEHIVHPAFERFDGAGLTLAAIVLIFLSLFALYILFSKQLSKINALKKISNILRGVIEGIKSVSRMQNFLLFIALSFAIFGMYLMQTYVMFFALESTSSLGLVDALFVLVLSAMAIILPVQGGIGAYHWIVSMGLTIFGLSREEGMVYATISHSVTSILFIVLGAISLIFVLKTSKKMKKNENLN